MNTTNPPTTVIILCFIFCAFSFLSWHCMENISKPANEQTSWRVKKSRCRQSTLEKVVWWNFYREIVSNNFIRLDSASPWFSICSVQSPWAKFLFLTCKLKVVIAHVKKRHHGHNQFAVLLCTTIHQTKSWMNRIFGCRCLLITHLCMNESRKWNVN